MGHNHRHHAHGDRKLTWAIAINLALTVAQIIGGVLSGSIALIADAIHNFADAGSLLIALLARRISRRPTDADMTFGYARAEVVAAVINYTTLIVIGFYLVAEAVMRLINPPEVDGWIMVVVAGIALVIDLGTAALTFSMSKDSVNIRAAFLHNIADALGSVAVIVAGGAVLLWDARLVDPLVTLGIAGYILWMAFSEIAPVIRILMLGSPPQLDIDAVIEVMEQVPDVQEVHHLHVWQMSKHRASLEAHVVVAEGCWDDVSTIKEALRQQLAIRFAILHTTLEMEKSAETCADAARIGSATP